MNFINKRRNRVLTKEEIYINHKKKGLLNHIDAYNKKSDDPFSVNKTNFDIETTLCKPNICKNCGDCCLTFPCVFSPSDFLDITDLEYMKRLLDTNLLCISDIPTRGILVIRPRGEGDFWIVSLYRDIVLNRGGYNPCILHSSKGCLLPAMNRPSEGLLHLPVTDSVEHYTLYNEWDITKEYTPYQETLLTLKEMYYNIYFPNNIRFPNVEEENIQKLARYMAGYKR